MTTPSEIRTYQGWRRQRGLGFAGLSSWETVAATAALVFGALALRTSFRWVAIILVALFLGSLARVQGRPLWTHIHLEVAVLRSRLLGRGRFVSQLVTPADPESSDVLPGPLAATSAYRVSAVGLLRDFGVVWNSALETVTVTWVVAPHTPHLSDPEEVDIWVASWHQLLARLGNTGPIAHVAVTVASGTEPDAVVADNLRRFRAAEAPDYSKRLLAELADREDSGTVFAETTVSVTFDTRRGAAGHRKDPESRISDVIPLVQSLDRDLRLVGIASARLKTLEELAIMLRGAFNPSARRALTNSLLEDQTSVLDWKTSGPTTASSHMDHFSHDGSRTMSWVLGDAPRSMVSSTVLHDLLAPTSFWKRVTFLWVPLPGGQAAKLLEREITASEAKRLATRRQRGEETQRERRDRDTAEKTATAEALGAGVGYFTVFASTTVEDVGDMETEEQDRLLSTARAAVENAGNQSKLVLRPAHANHDLVLYGSLGVGINPAKASNWVMK